MIEKYNKAIKIDVNYMDAFNKKVVIIYNLIKYKETIQFQNKAI